MEDFGADSARLVLLEEPCDGKAHDKQVFSGIEFSLPEEGGGRLDGALHQKEGEDDEVPVHFQEELEPGIIASGIAVVGGPEDRKCCQVPSGSEVEGHRELMRYGLEELLGLWEVSVKCETTWNHVLDALSPLMEEMYEMQAMADATYRRRRSKNSERRQRFKARREAMLSISENKQDSESTSGERKNDHCDDGMDSNAQASDELHLVKIQNGPLRGRFKGRQFHYDSDEYVESFQPQAFAVDGEPDFESGDPQDGWEYLRRVIWEAARCPKVVVANIDPGKLVSEQTTYMPEIPVIPSCPPNLLPSKEWETMFLADFTQLRKEMSKLHAPLESCSERLPSVRDKAAWEIICFGAVTSTQAEDLEKPVTPTIEADCGDSPSYEEVDGAADDKFVELHPPSTGASNNVVSDKTECADKVSDLPSLEFEGQATRRDIENDDTIQLGSQEGTGGERLQSSEPPEVEINYSSGSTEARGDSACTSRLQGPSEENLVSYDHEGSSVETADTRTLLRRDSSHPNESQQADQTDKVSFLASSDVQFIVAPLPETTVSHVRVEEEFSAEESDHLAAATEFAHTSDRFPEPSGPGGDHYTPEDTPPSCDLLYDPVDPRGEDITNDCSADCYDFAAHCHEAPQYEDDDLQTAELMESLVGFEVFSSKNLLEESEDERGESISEIDDSAQQLFTGVFGVDKAWEQPFIHTLLRLDVVSRATLFRHHVSWLESVEDLPQERALWLLGLAAVVDTPLNGDTTAAFRALLRYCAGVRASKQALSDEELHMLNALITVAGLYFGQAEAEFT